MDTDLESFQSEFHSIFILYIHSIILQELLSICPACPTLARRAKHRKPTRNIDDNTRRMGSHTFKGHGHA